MRPPRRTSTANHRTTAGSVRIREGEHHACKDAYIHARLGAIDSALESSDPAPTAIAATTWDNWYAQAAYRLAGISDDPVIGNFEPAVRYSQLLVEGFSGFKDNEESR